MGGVGGGGEHHSINVCMVNVFGIMDFPSVSTVALSISCDAEISLAFVVNLPKGKLIFEIHTLFSPEDMFIDFREREEGVGERETEGEPSM